MATKKASTSNRTNRSTRKTTGSGARKAAGSDGAAKSSSTAKRTTATRTTKRASAPRASAPKRKPGTVIAAEAARQLLELTGREAEGVTGLERTEDGWRVEVEVVEVRRIPDTTDVLALYELTLDADGELEGYRRVRRYSRGAAGQESR